MEKLLMFLSFLTIILCYIECIRHPKVYHTISQFAAKSYRVNKYVLCLVIFTNLRVLLKHPFYRKVLLLKTSPNVELTWFDVLEVPISWLVLLKLEKEKPIQSLLHCLGALVVMIHGMTRLFMYKYVNFNYAPLALLGMCIYLTLLYAIKTSSIGRHAALFSEILIFTLCIYAR